MPKKKQRKPRVLAEFEAWAAIIEDGTLEARVPVLSCVGPYLYSSEADAAPWGKPIRVRVTVREVGK